MTPLVCVCVCVCVSPSSVSVSALVLILLLFFSELSLYLRTETRDHLLVDVSRGEKLRINFDITFPHIPCNLLSVDAMDVSGSHQLDVSHHIVCDGEQIRHSASVGPAKLQV
jgi:hypothetical protein